MVINEDDVVIGLNDNDVYVLKEVFTFFFQSADAIQTRGTVSEHELEVLLAAKADVIQLWKKLSGEDLLETVH